MPGWWMSENRIDELWLDTLMMLQIPAAMSLWSSTGYILISISITISINITIATTIIIATTITTIIITIALTIITTLLPYHLTISQSTPPNYNNDHDDGDHDNPSWSWSWSLSSYYHISPVQSLGVRNVLWFHSSNQQNIASLSDDYDV